MVSRHSRLRLAVAAACGLVSALYLLTGTGLIAVTEDQEPGAIPPLLVGAGVFALLALLVARGAGRAVLAAGALVQLPVLGMYLAVAPERDPSFEPWGLTIKALQVFLLVAFVRLATRRAEPRQAAPRSASTTGAAASDVSTTTSAHLSGSASAR
jgi:hypothetical protein